MEKFKYFSKTTSLEIFRVLQSIVKENHSVCPLRFIDWEVHTILFHEGARGLCQWYGQTP